MDWSEERERAFITRMTARSAGELSSADVAAFRRLVRDFYRAHGRGGLPWRHTCDPYRILVSEVMLQQTQVSRVEATYAVFLEAFPDARSLAAAPLAEVLRVWRGLGYNRRAAQLKQLAEAVVASHGGEIPASAEELRRLPAVGPATAAAVMASAFGEAMPYVETNIRAVYLHVFFSNATDVPDSSLLPLVARTLDRRDPQGWYWALMDYGAALKRRAPNPSRRSRHHVRQAPFSGSAREARGRVLRALLDGISPDVEALAEVTGLETDRVAPALADLARDGLIAGSARGPKPRRQTRPPMGP